MAGEQCVPEKLLLSLRKFVAPEVVFGWGALELAGRQAAGLGVRRPLLVADPGLFAFGWPQRVQASLEQAGLDVCVFCDFSSNPRGHEVMAGVAAFTSQDRDALVAVGGGAAMDCAKAIGIARANGCHILALEGVDNVLRPGPPLVCVPTTAGSGAEVSQFTIVTDPGRKLKVAIASRTLIPDMALIDPEVTVSMPPVLTAHTGLDTLTHAMEAYVSNAHGPLTDLLAEEALRLIRAHLLRAIAAPDDREARGGMALASLYAGMAFSNAILGAIHAMAHGLGGLLDLPHGLCNALLMEHVVAANYESAAARYDRIGHLLGAEIDARAPDSVRKAAVLATLGAFKTAAGFSPMSLSDVGLTPGDLAKLAANAAADPCMLTNPRPLAPRDIEAIYEIACQRRPDREDRRSRLLGFGEHSVSKSYFPELGRRLDELERFRSLLDQTGDAIFLVDGRTGRISDAAGSAGLMLRAAREALIGRLFEELLPPEAVLRLRGLLCGDFAAGRIETSLALPEDHAAARPPVEMTFRLAAGKDGPMAVIVARDISERKKSEEALRLAEERYRTIVENAAEGIYQCDLDGRPISANPAMVAILGYASFQDLRQHIRNVVDDVLVHPADRQRIRNEIDRYGQIKNFELLLVTKTGSHIWGQISSRLVRDAKGRPERIDGSLQDVTIRKRAEETLRRYHEELEARVDERTAELTRANERLTHEVTIRKRAEEAAEAANRAKSDFLSMVSHEIRTPLTSVLGFAVIIEKRLRQLLTPLIADNPRQIRQADQILENLGIIVSEGERLKHLINDVLDLAKLEAGKMAFRRDRVGPASVINHVMAASAGLIQGKDVRLETVIDGHLPEVLGDRDRLIQVLVNLVSNALKFTEQGTVTCRARAQGHYVVVDVADTGIGIPEAEHYKVFEKFNQIGTSLTTKPKGTGLGLAICRHIVESHGGRIFFVSKPGAGSTFTFTLPIA